MDELINIFTKRIFTALTAELERQGHKLTGALIQSFEHEVKETASSTLINFIMNNYGLVLNDGVPPERVPYTPPPPRRGGKSKYIQGLIRWARLKFRYDEKRARSVAFAVARKHKQRGMPLTEKGFFNKALAAEEETIKQFVIEYTIISIEEFLKAFDKK